MELTVSENLHSECVSHLGLRRNEEPGSATCIYILQKGDSTHD
jgi:hypothetical protein